MIKLKNDDVITFVDEIYKHCSSGEITRAEMYGHHMEFLPFSNRDIIRMNVTQKLRNIKNHSQNIQRLIDMNVLTSAQMEKIKNCSPDFVADVLRAYMQYDNKGHSKK